MPQDPIYGEVEVLTPAEQQTKGLLPQHAGPLTSHVTSPPFSGPPVTGFEGFQPDPQSRLSRAVVAGAPIGAGLIGGALGGGPFGAAAAAGATKGVLSGSPSAGVMESLGWLGGGLLGKVPGAVAGAVSKSAALSKMSTAVEGQAVKLLQQRVPAWKGFKTLTEMFHGQNALSTAYDTSLKAVMEKGAQQSVTVPANVATELGLFGKGAKDLADLPIPVNASELAQAMTGQWKKAPNAYRKAAEALDAAGIGDPAARAAYRWGTGAIDYLHATKGLVGETLNLDRVMAGLVDKKKWNILRVRGMEEFAQVLRGTGKAPITTGAASPLTKGASGIAGFLAGLPVGHPFPAYYAGKAAAEAAGKVKGSIPELPIVQLLRQAGKLGGPLGASGVEAITP